jgi:DNA-directed RNA polymerase subunit RPC12/RpoP
MAQPVCFTCGLEVGEPYQLNRLANGRVCPTCRDRVLDSLPPVLPGTPDFRPEPVDVDAVSEDAEEPPVAS